MKPVRPWNAYLLFFQLERAWLLQNTGSPDTDEASQITEGHELGRLIDPLMPIRYRDIYLSRTWYVSASNKRKHRKSHGKISFHNISLRIAERWNKLKEIDPETEKYCAKIAKREMQSYKKKVKMYDEITDTDAVRSTPSSNICASTGSYSSPIAKRSSDSPILKLQNQTSSAKETESSGLVSTSSFMRKERSTLEVSSDFYFTLTKGRGKLNVTGYTSFEVKTNPATNRKPTEEAEFSFIPIPASLLEQEDEFLKRCQKRARLLPIDSFRQFECNPRTDSASKNDVVFDSTDRRSFYALNECKNFNMSTKTSPSDASQSLCEDISPLQLGDSIKFTEDDSEMLLKALF